MSTLKIGYFADGPWSHKALSKILADSSMSIEFICARSDNPDGVLRKEAEKYGLDFFFDKSINSETFRARVREYACDVFVSMSFNQIFGLDLISVPPLGVINCHAGMLPFYRGRNVLNWALINDEKEFGVTVHYVDTGIDTGDLILQRSFPISDNDDYKSLLERAYVGCSEVLYDALLDVAGGRIVSVPQTSIHPFGFYCTKRIAGDERLNWSQSSREVFNFVRAVCAPGPQALTLLNGRELKVNRVALLSDAPVFKGIPGAILSVGKSGFLVKTQDSFVKVLEWTCSVDPKVGDRLA